MRDLDIPPPTSTLEYFRSEVNQRAEALRRQRLRARRGVTAAGLVLVLVVALAIVHRAGPATHASASSGSQAHPAAGLHLHPASGFGRAVNSAPGVPRTGVATQRPTAAGSSDGSPGASAGGNTAGANTAGGNTAGGNTIGGNTAGGPAGATTQGSAEVLVERPSGLVWTTGMHRSVLIVLRASGRRWGPVVLGPGTAGVLTVVRQAQVGGFEQVELRTHRSGTASVTVPLVGHPASSWHATIVVT